MLFSGALGVVAGLFIAGMLLVLVPSFRRPAIDEFREFLDEVRRKMDQ